MSKRPRDNRPYLPPVKRIELPEGNVKLRWILIVVLLAIGSVAIATGVHEALNTRPGWNEVTAISDQTSCATEFKLMYDFSKSGGNASAENKKLTEVYSDACEKAFLIFSPDVAGDGNLHSLNSHINEPVAVNPVLYRALELVNRYDNRCVFLAPVYVEYDRIFLSGSDGEAALYDPQRDPEAGAYVQELMNYIADPAHIRLELLGENTVQLTVSDAYLAFAEEYGLEGLLDFGWMKNAFVADYLADTLEQSGFIYGYLSSYDGFTRNLYPDEADFALSIFDRLGDTIYLPAELHYSGRQNIVFLRDFPMTALDQWRYYAYEDGTISSVLLDPATGIPTASVATMISLSENLPCAQILMEMLPAFLTTEFSLDHVHALMEQGISSIWCQDAKVFTNADDLNLRLLDTGIKEGYEIQFVN